MELKAVLFDLGGTLIYYPFLEDLEVVCRDCWREIGLEQKILLRMYEIFDRKEKESSRSFREAVISEILSQVLKESGKSIGPQEFENILWKIHYFQNVRREKLYPGARKVLKETRGLGLKIGLISNTPFPGKLHEYDLKRFRISSYFNVKIWSSEFGFKKPHPVIFLEALSRLQVKPWEVIHIGDRFKKDVAGPNGIRIPAIWVSQKEKREFNGWQVKEIKEVINIIRDLKEGGEF